VITKLYAEEEKNGRPLLGSERLGREENMLLYFDAEEKDL